MSAGRWLAGLLTSEIHELDGTFSIFLLGLNYRLLGCWNWGRGRQLGVRAELEPCSYFSPFRKNFKLSRQEHTWDKTSVQQLAIQPDNRGLSLPCPSLSSDPSFPTAAYQNSLQDAASAFLHNELCLLQALPFVVPEDGGRLLSGTFSS